MTDERRRRGWTQTRLSAFTGIAQSDLSAIENGRRQPGVGWRKKLALVFGMPEAELFAPVTTDTEQQQAAR
jgi:transcriptional regulator with XRE-family HTH domain